MGSPEDSEKWASGSFLSDLNKAGSAISCLEIVLFIWIPTTTKLLTTSVDLWWRLGRVYGFFVTIIGIIYICLIIRNALCFVPYRRQEVEKNRDRAAIVKPILSSIDEITIQNCSEAALARFMQAQAKFQDRVRESSTVLIFQNLIPNTIFYGGFFVMAVATTQHTGRVEHFTNMVMHMSQLQTPLQSISASIQKFLDRAVNCERIISVLKKKKIIEPTGAIEMGLAPAEVAFDSLYTASIERLSFVCKSGAITIHSGISGPAREQLVRILARIEDPKLGTVRINAIDIRAYSIKSLRHNIAFIPREYKLLGDTVIQCLVCGLDNPGSIDMGSVIAACKDVNVHDLILNLQGGYDAPVNRVYLTLNSEERRRFALVTAIIRKCGVLVLDGAISALKSETVQELQEVVKTASDGRTVIVLE